MNDMSNLPDIGSAKLPSTYVAAKAALAECQQVDECKDWADKAAALASYAKQSKDDALEKMALRIRARAIRRAGELLKQFETTPGARNDLPTSGRNRPEVTRSEAAREAGFSERQQKQAVNIANVAEKDFEDQVESLKPPTLTELAQQGIKPKPFQPVDLEGLSPADFSRAMQFTGLIERYARDLGEQDIDAVLQDLSEQRSNRVRRAIAAIDAIHDRIITRI